MKKRSVLSYFILGSLFMCCMGTVLATTLFKPIRASINPSYTYTVNGNRVLKNKPAILYKGTIYAPITDLTTALGYNASVGESSATITTPPKPNNDTTTMNNAIITAIDFAANRITIYPSNNPSKQIDLLITPNTRITDTRTNHVYDITELNTNMIVQATYSSKMTKTNPPQSTATAIKIISPQSQIQPR